MNSDNNEGIDASTFQMQLGEAAKTLIHLVERAALKECGLPAFVADDIGVMLRFSYSIHAHLFYLYANTYNKADPHCLPEYGFVILPQTRVLIDCLYNIVLILEEPAINGRRFRADGYRQLFASITEDEQQTSIGDNQRRHLRDMRAHYKLSQRVDGLKNEEIASGSWQTLSGYISANTKQAKNLANIIF